MNEENYYEKIVVASFDILGFKKRIMADSKNAAIILENFCGNAIGGDGVYDLEGGLKILNFYGKIEQYSDSIFLYGDHKKSTEDQLKWMTVMAAKTIALGFKYKFPYAVRCGIAIGNLHEIPLNKYGKDISVFTGTSVVKAYEIEQDQNWAGGAIHEDIAAYATGEYIKIFNEIPWKCDTRTRTRTNKAVNWCKVLLDNDMDKAQLKSKINQVFNEDEVEVQKKKNNTINFIENQ